MKCLFLITFLFASIHSYAQKRRDLIGCWTMPGLKAEYLSLDSEGNFFFNDYQEITRSFEPIFGAWRISGGILELHYDEQKQIRFKIRMTDGNAWVLVRPGKIRLFKAGPNDCGQP